MRLPLQHMLQLLSDYISIKSPWTGVTLNFAVIVLTLDGLWCDYVACAVSRNAAVGDFTSVFFL